MSQTFINKVLESIIQYADEIEFPSVDDLSYLLRELETFTYEPCSRLDDFQKGIAPWSKTSREELLSHQRAVDAGYTLDNEDPQTTPSQEEQDDDSSNEDTESYVLPSTKQCDPYSAAGLIKAVSSDKPIYKQWIELLDTEREELITNLGLPELELKDENETQEDKEDKENKEDTITTLTQTVEESEEQVDPELKTVEETLYTTPETVEETEEDLPGLGHNCGMFSVTGSFTPSEKRVARSIIVSVLADVYTCGYNTNDIFIKKRNLKDKFKQNLRLVVRNPNYFELTSSAGRSRWFGLMEAVLKEGVASGFFGRDEKRGYYYKSS